MSLKNLGNKQTIVIHNCQIENQKYDLVITPHTQTTEYIHTKRQTLRNTIISKQRQITRKRFSKNRNAFSESEVSSLDALYKVEDTINQSYPIQDSVYFSDSETNTIASKKGRNRIKKKHKRKSVHLYNWSQPIRHINNYLLTVVKRKKDQPHSQ